MKLSFESSFKRPSIRGFTLIEMIISAAIGSLTLAAAVSMYQAHTKSTKSMSQLLNEKMDVSLVERILYLDLRLAEMSFQALNLADDSSSASRPVNFYDLGTDLKCVCKTPSEAQGCASSQWQLGEAAGSCYRSFTLTRSSAASAKAFYVLVEDQQFGSAVPFHVADAYDSSPPTQIGEAGVLTYRGIARLRSLPSVFRPLDETSKVVNGTEFWDRAKKKMILVNVPVPLRGQGASGLVDPATFPRMAIYLGTADRASNPADLRKLTLSGLSGLSVQDRHPVNRESTFTSTDDFFRRMPLVGGVSPQVLVRPVKLYRYELTSQGELIRNEYDVTSESVPRFINSSKLGIAVESLKFMREVNETAVRFTVVTNRSLRMSR